MIIDDPEDYATESDGSKNDEYCLHCYKKGKFTFNGSFEDFLEKQVDISARMLGMSPADAEFEARRKLPTLNRWKHKSVEDEDSL
jgi:hypothetical protein